MKILFLDIDGVLNSYQSARMLHHIRRNEKETPEYIQRFLLEKEGLDVCPLAISNLEYLLEEVKELKIVLSSTWRLGLDLKGIKKLFPMSELIRERIIDSTPCLRSDCQRGDEIKRWLINTSYRVRKFAVLDDDSDMKAVEDDFFHVNHKVGLDYIMVESLIRHFNSFS
jgi:hypothetical protein